jgi:hypothetical protein
MGMQQWMYGFFSVRAPHVSRQFIFVLHHGWHSDHIWASITAFSGCSTRMSDRVQLFVSVGGPATSIPEPYHSAGLNCRTISLLKVPLVPRAYRFSLLKEWVASLMIGLSSVDLLQVCPDEDGSDSHVAGLVDARACRSR